MGGGTSAALASSLHALHELPLHGVQELGRARLLPALRRRQPDVQRHARVKLRLQHKQANLRGSVELGDTMGAQA